MLMGLQLPFEVFGFFLKAELTLANFRSEGKTKFSIQKVMFS